MVIFAMSIMASAGNPPQSPFSKGGRVAPANLVSSSGFLDRSPSLRSRVTSRDEAISHFTAMKIEIASSFHSSQ